MSVRSLIFIFLFWTHLSWSQTDSSYTDTVIVVQPPLVINRQVHVEVPVYSKKETGLDIGAYYSLQKNLAPSSQTKASVFQSAGLLVRYHEGRVEIGTGLGLMNTQIRYEVPVQQEVPFTTTKTIIDTLDCYTVITPRGVSTVCNTETKEIVLQGTERVTYTIPQIASISYLQVPLSLGYSFQKQKWHFTPSAQLIFTKKLSKEIYYLPLKGQVWMAGAQVSIGYSLTRHVLAEVKAQYQTNLSSVYTTTQSEEDWNLLGLGLALFWRF